MKNAIFYSLILLNVLGIQAQVMLDDTYVELSYRSITNVDNNFYEPFEESIIDTAVYLSPQFGLSMDFAMSHEIVELSEKLGRDFTAGFRTSFRFTYYWVATSGEYESVPYYDGEYDEWLSHDGDSWALDVAIGPSLKYDLGFMKLCGYTQLGVNLFHFSSNTTYQVNKESAQFLGYSLDYNDDNYYDGFDVEQYHYDFVDINRIYFSFNAGFMMLFEDRISLGLEYNQAFPGTAIITETSKEGKNLSTLTMTLGFSLSYLD